MTKISNPITLTPRFWGLLPCAGQGTRAGGSVPKQYQVLFDKPLVQHTIEALALVQEINQLVIVVSTDDNFCDKYSELVQVAKCGGATRAKSVLNGLRYIESAGAEVTDWVLVHDAARCLIRTEDVARLISICKDDSVGGLLALSLSDTLKSELSGRSIDTIDRQDKWLAQTPQMFRLGALEKALTLAGDQVTDESSAMEAMGFKPLLVQGHVENFKITYPADFSLAKAVLLSRNLDSIKSDTMNMRIGEGWDIHALVAGRPLILGGVHVPYEKGLQGHSDADVLLHAITDALLGAAGLGDIGRHFPDTDDQFKGVDSLVLLRTATFKVREAGFKVGNVDATVIAQAPKLAPFIPLMCQKISKAINVDVSQVNVKAKTSENMGPVGLEEAIEARAIVLLELLS